MNSPSDNIHTALGLVQDKKVRVRALGRGARSKISYIFPHKLTVTENLSMHLLNVWGGKWGSAQYLYSIWSQALVSSHGLLGRHFTQLKIAGIVLGGKTVLS